MASKKNKTQKLRPSSAKKDEGDALWDEVANTVKRQASSRISPVALPAKGQKKRPLAKKIPANAKKSINLRNNAAPKMDSDNSGLVTGPANLSQPVYAGIDRSSAKKLQQGKMVLEARIDLHGLSQLAAHQRLQHFIQKSRQEGLRTILVITGKGKAGRGVLREKVPQWLSEPPLSEAIIAFGASRPQDGGAGALYVRLKRARERL
jgi:DNA-nicking Smr family endonuclease